MATIAASHGINVLSRSLALLGWVCFGLSQVEAEALYARITRFNSDYYEGSRGPGQKPKTVAAWGDPASKPIV